MHVLTKRLLSLTMGKEAKGVEFGTGESTPQPKPQPVATG